MYDPDNLPKLDTNADLATRLQKSMMTYVASSVKKPVDASDLRLRSFCYVSAFKPAAGQFPYWRIPVYLRSLARIIGYFDIRTLSGVPAPVRVSSIPRVPVTHLADLSSISVDILEMSRLQIKHELSALPEFDSDERYNLELVFDEAETRIGIKVAETDLNGVVKSAIVTPGYTYRIE